MYSASRQAWIQRALVSGFVVRNRKWSDHKAQINHARQVASQSLDTRYWIIRDRKAGRVCTIHDHTDHEMPLLEQPFLGQDTSSG